MFDSCEKLRRVVLNHGLEVIGQESFRECKSLEPQFVIPATVHTILPYAFRDCESLEEVIIPHDSLMTALPDGLFSGCTSLKKVGIINSIRTLGSEVFKNCKSLESIHLPQESGLVVIPQDAFHKCESLVEVEVPWGVKEIMSSAFVGCSYLEILSLPETVEKIQSFALQTRSDKIKTVKIVSSSVEGFERCKKVVEKSLYNPKPEVVMVERAPSLLAISVRACLPCFSTHTHYCSFQ